MRYPEAKRIGLGIVGAGRVGLIRAEIAARFPQVDFIGIAERRPERAAFVAQRVSADFVTADYQELFARPELTAAVISTDEHLHVEPILAAAERGLALMIEKPLATGLADSARVCSWRSESCKTRWASTSSSSWAIATLPPSSSRWSAGK